MTYHPALYIHIKWIWFLFCLYYFVPSILRSLFCPFYSTFIILSFMLSYCLEHCFHIVTRIYSPILTNLCCVRFAISFIYSYSPSDKLIEYAENLPSSERAIQNPLGHLESLRSLSFSCHFSSVTSKNVFLEASPTILYFSVCKLRCFLFAKFVLEYEML